MRAWWKNRVVPFISSHVVHFDEEWDVDPKCCKWLRPGAVQVSFPGIWYWVSCRQLQTGKSRTGKHVPGLNKTVSSISIHSHWKLSLCRTHPHPSGNGVYIIVSPLLSFCSWGQNNFLSDLTSLFSNSEIKLQAQNNEFGSYLHFTLFFELFPCISEMAHVSFKCFQIEAMPKWRLGYPLHG